MIEQLGLVAIGAALGYAGARYQEWLKVKRAMRKEGGMMPPPPQQEEKPIAGSSLPPLPKRTFESFSDDG